MKKIRIVLMTFVMLLLMSGVAMADDTEVYVSIADQNGEAVLVQKPVTVTDVDNDGTLTVGDALVCAHEAYYEGGAEKGIKTSIGNYGLQLDLLWGYDNGSGYGYLVNNVFSMGLGDPVKNGDYVYAYIYTDIVTWSDTYSFFDKNTVSAKAGDEISLVLSAAGYAADYSQLNSPVEGAHILVDGVDVLTVTDAEGKATIKIDKAGEHVISAVKFNTVLVPPLCVATIESKAEPTAEPTEEPTITATPSPTPTSTPTVSAETDKVVNDNSKPKTPVVLILCIVLGLIVVAIIAVVILKRKKD